MKEKRINAKEVTSLRFVLESEQRLHPNYKISLDIDQDTRTITVRYAPKRMAPGEDLTKVIDRFTKQLNAKKLERFDKKFPDE